LVIAKAAASARPAKSRTNDEDAIADRVNATAHADV